MELGTFKVQTLKESKLLNSLETLDICIKFERVYLS
jgi:hypothetical protein